MSAHSKKGQDRNVEKQKANARLSGLFGSNSRKVGLDADWLAVEPALLLNLVWAVDFFGGSVTLGSTRNNSAYVVKVYIGAPFDPMYFDGDEEGRAALAAWVDSLVTAAAESA